MDPGDRTAQLRERLRQPRPILLDGATGTELERRGVSSDLPLWSARALLEAPDQVEEIHAEYVAAGAEILTANTFRTQRRTLKRGGLAERSAELTSLAVALARRSVGKGRGFVFVAGSASPLEDCYRPDLVPDAKSLAREHGEHAHNLAEAGVDLILVETMNAIDEANAAARAAASTGLPFCVSFVCGEDARLLSGEPLSRAVDVVANHAPTALLVNCLPPSRVAPCLAALQRSGLPFGVYPNLGAPSPVSAVRPTHPPEPANR